MFAPLAGVVGSVQDPLDEDHGDEVTEEEQEEHQLWDELQEYGVILGVVDFVPQTLIRIRLEFLQGSKRGRGNV